MVIPLVNIQKPEDYNWQALFIEWAAADDVFRPEFLNSVVFIRHPTKRPICPRCPALCVKPIVHTSVWLFLSQGVQSSGLSFLRAYSLQDFHFWGRIIFRGFILEGVQSPGLHSSGRTVFRLLSRQGLESFKSFILQVFQLSLIFSAFCSFSKACLSLLGRISVFQFPHCQERAFRVGWFPCTIQT